MTAPAEFSERLFEFAFNCNFAKRYKAALLSSPFIPSQNQEGTDAFDAVFELLIGGDYELRFFQHKVPLYVDAPSGSNSHFVKQVGLPYFRVPLDNNQYRLVRSLGSRRRTFPISIEYCSPRFWRHDDLNRRFMKSRIIDHSISIDVQDCGPLTAGAHSLVYPAMGPLDAWRFSKEPAIARVRTFDSKGQADRNREVQALRPVELLAQIVRTIRAPVARFVGMQLPGLDWVAMNEDPRRATVALSRLLGNTLGVTSFVVPAGELP